MLEVLLTLPAVAIEPLTEIALAVEQADADEWHTQIGCALDVVASEHAEPAGIDREGLVQSELGREVADRARAQDARVRRRPGLVRLEVLALPAVGVVDAAVQRQLAGALLDLRQRGFLEQRDRVVIQLTPASRLQILEQAARVLVPAPPQVARERPQLFLRRRDEPVHDAGLADDRRHLGGGRRHRLDLLVGEVTRLERLHHQRALQHAVVDERHAEERLERLFARLAEILEARVRLRVLHGHRPDQLGDQADETLVQAEAERADALGPQPDGRGEDQVDAVGLE